MHDSDSRAHTSPWGAQPTNPATGCSRLPSHRGPGGVRTQPCAWSAVHCLPRDPAEELLPRPG